MINDFHEYFAQVYGQDADISGPHGWIQWKGTDVCMDMHCSCGHHGHIDADFFYYYECVCGKRYAVGQVVKLIELTTEQVEYETARAGHDIFKRDQIDGEGD